MDLLFLDIALGEESGIALAAEINRTYPDAIIVFVSSYPYYVTDAYNVQAAQFFVKPLQYEIFQREYERLLKRYDTVQDAFTRKDIELGELTLHKSDVVYIESYKRVLTAHTVDKKTYSYYGKIGDEELFFADSAIVRCHRGYLVNLAHILNITRDGIVVKFGDTSTATVPVSESAFDTVRSKFIQHISKR
jgi:DNA-binding LytR/AlgR family response regulator